MKFLVQQGGALQGECMPPGDKSITHRALMLAVRAQGISTIEGALAAADCAATRTALEALGAQIEGELAGTLRVQGLGAEGFRQAQGAINLGNSGTSMRLLAGLLAGRPFDTVLTGDESLLRRPMGRIAEPLARMGARIETASGGTAPLCIRGGHPLRGVRWEMPMASAQVKSCLLLAALDAEGQTAIREPLPSRDHTERLLGRFGCPVQREGDWLLLDGGRDLEGCSVTVPGDFSSAMFLLAGAAIAPGSDLLIQNVGLNPGRTGGLTLLRAMGADIEILGERESSGEPVADLRVRGSALSGIEIAPQAVPGAIDEFPALFIAAAAAVGTTVLRGAAELRHKESDRIAVMAAGLTALGIHAEELPDGIKIRGGELRGGSVSGAGDHRAAMAFAIAGLAASGEIQVQDCEQVETSWPGFAEALAGLGLGITEAS